MLVRRAHTGEGKNDGTGKRSSQAHGKMDEDKTSPKHIYLYKYLNLFIIYYLYFNIDIFP